MTDRMTVIDLHKTGSTEEMHPFEDRSRHYRAFRGKRTGGGRVSSLLFIPHTGTHMRRLQLAHLQTSDIAIDGTEIILEFMHLIAVLSGRNLLPVEIGISAGWIGAVEAFNPERRDAPAKNDGEPFIEQIRFYAKDGPEPEAKPKKPRHEPETQRA